MLTVVKAFVDLTAAFVPGSGVAARMLGQVATSTGFLKEVLPKATPDPETSELSGGNADAIAGKLDDALLKLRRQIFETEGEVYYSSDRMLDIVFDHAADFHINRCGRSRARGRQRRAGSLKNEIHADLSVLKEVGYRELPEIAAELVKAGQAATAAVHRHALEPPLEHRVG